MAFVLKETKEKIKSEYKTLYLSKTLIDAVQKIAQENDTSFNNVVVSMVEYCLREENTNQ